MRRIVPAAVVLAALCACAGYSGGTYNVDDGGPPPVSTGGGDAGDGGHDGGDAGPDAGDAGDAGCAALSMNAASIVDNCVAPDNRTVGTVSVNTASCTVDINTGDGFVCTGTVSGAHDAFDGGCNSLSCTASSLPGTINCGSCTIVICDGGCP